MNAFADRHFAQRLDMSIRHVDGSLLSRSLPLIIIILSRQSRFVDCRGVRFVAGRLEVFVFFFLNIFFRVAKMFPASRQDEGTFRRLAKLYISTRAIKIVISTTFYDNNEQQAHAKKRERGREKRRWFLNKLLLLPLRHVEHSCGEERKREKKRFL